MQERGGGRDGIRRWWWEGKEIEEVNTYRYLGYILQRNNGNEMHVKERVKKAHIVMRWVWGFGERKFREDWRWRWTLFDALVKSVMAYGVEIWGFKEWRAVEGVQEKYIRWVLGLEWNTPGHIVREEGKINKFRIVTGGRAMSFEEKMIRGEGKELLKECYRERERDEKENVWTDASVERKEYLWRCGTSEMDWEARGRCVEWLKSKDREVQDQERYNRIERSRYNKRYRNIKTIGLPRYIMIGKEKRERIKYIAKARCGNVERSRKYWEKGEEVRCKICMCGEESWEHWISECAEIERWNGSVEEVLCDEGKGYEWLKIVIDKKEYVEKKEKEESRKETPDKV